MWDGVVGGVDEGGGWGEGVVLEAGALALDEVVEGGFVVLFGDASLGPCGVVVFGVDVMPIDAGWVVEADVCPRGMVTFAATEQVDLWVAVIAGCCGCGVQRWFPVVVVTAISR